MTFLKPKIGTPYDCLRVKLKNYENKNVFNVRHPVEFFKGFIALRGQI